MQSEAKQLGINFFMKTYVIKKIIKIWKMGLYLGVIRSVKGMYFRKNGSVLVMYFFIIGQFEIFVNGFFSLKY